MIKVLIVDDSALIRQSFKEMLDSDPEIEVVATASDPYNAVKKLQKVKPDVITLDVVMPKMDGLTFLKKIMKQAPMPVVVVSGQTSHGAETALKALEYGAADIMAKPKLSSPALMEEAKIALIDRIKSTFYAGKKAYKRNGISEGNSVNRKVAELKRQYSSNTLIAIGASTGGTDAIKDVLKSMPVNCPPILIVQHMPEKFTASFAKRLDECCKIHVKEAEHNEIIQNGTAYIAPGNFHMSVTKTNNNRYVKISSGELVNRHRPSVNVLFDSVSDQIGKNAIGVILTGMGDDGATGMQKMSAKGAFTIAQDENSSVVFGMPLRAIEKNAVDKILPLDQISATICNYLEEI